jgi:hypothetical protein
MASATPDYKALYERVKRELEKQYKIVESYQCTEEHFFDLLERHFEDEAYRLLWNEVNSLCRDTYIHQHLTEPQLERNIVHISVAEYFPRDTTRDEERAFLARQDTDNEEE